MITNKKIAIILMLLFGIFFFITACSEDDTGGAVNTEPATVYFFNESGYIVDVYYLNPDPDPSALVCTLKSMETKDVKLYPSFDQVMGDAFYPRYKIPLADGMEPGTKAADVYAERVLTNLTFVIKSGQDNHITIPQPKPGELKLVDGYIIVFNNTNTQIQILRGNTIQSRHDNDSIYIDAYRMGYYRIPFSYLDGGTVTISQLKAFSSFNIPFPSFTMERGKFIAYEFTVQEGSVTGPKENYFAGVTY